MMQAQSRLVALVDHINRLLSKNRFDEVDRSLKLSDVQTEKPEVMLVYLRGTFAARTLLKEWGPYLDRAHTELSRRGLDADRLLKGLNCLSQSC